ncbi:hypothetical protein [uncultured Marinobacter sp.]|uniref:hypothetical protein n=1 Tax=uncultured Marinobacter sp. TaxID=187379 RepID=UPI002619582E|nr:hypothetical protein [uncultured Marinobacter sp.]
MKEFYIRNKVSKNKCLRYSCEFGPVEEVDVGSVLLNPRMKACYVRFSKGFLGVIGSVSGPVLFFNDRRFYFSNPNWNVKVENKNVFYLFENGIEVLKEKYNSPPLDELDPWSDEESEDFFIWLEAKRNDEEFMEMWTLCKV